MFKKNPQPKASANIKSSERRKLYQEICSTYGLEPQNILKDVEVQILPMTTKQATFKSPQGISGTIYRDENETPTWFRPRGGKIHPSVFTLWKVPLIPTVMTHPHVIDVLQNGADLMLPGTIPPFDSRCSKGTVVGVVDSKHPSVIKAVGVCNLNLTQFSSVVGRTGTAVEILHHMSDELVALNKLVDIAVPENVENPLDKVVEQDNGNKDETLEGNEENVENSDFSETVTEATSDSHAEEEPTQESALETNKDDIEFGISTEDLDHLFIRATLQAIKVDNIDLPVSSSTFMSSHVLKNLPAMDSSYCNVKKTSWKKTAKFLKSLEKLGYLTTKGKGDDVTVTSLISKENPTIQNFVTHKTVQSTSNPSKPPTKKKKDHELNVVYLYKPTSKLRPIFNRIDKEFDNFYTSVEVRRVLDDYIKAADLVDKKNPKVVRLDDELSAATRLKESCPRDKLYSSFLTSFAVNHSIVKPGEPKGAMFKGEPPKIAIITEMRLGRKVVTRVQNFEHYFIKPHVLAEELRTKCSGSSTIGQSIQNPSITEVTVQGPHAKLITDLLNKDKGIPVSFIDVEDKTKKKKKK